MVRKFLDELLHIETESGVATEAFYDAWAETYDEDLAEAGYVAPRRCAQALAAASPDFASPLLDLGCGTGLAGVALRAVGFRIIDGWDLSAEMLRRAEARNVYRVLRQTEPDRPVTGAPRAYRSVAAVGVFTPGHAPASAVDDCVALLPPGGFMVFTLNDEALRDGSHEARLDAAVTAGRVRLVSRSHGPHIPAIDIGSDVIVLERL